ncbi:MULTISPECIES: hypothetical protein [Spirulina sp. CCY15215]|uniref:hypothetical protein n=1 Tax=Spirulina sp. CCY15215 TaxID=2767591 RepID=UPI001950220E|nr:hypothetical protein [Spirulina major]
MATLEQVKEYLACWFQLGKGIEIAGEDRVLRFTSILHGDRYSREFENCWENILRSQGQGFSLEGTEQSVDELFSSHWEMQSCSRCQLPIPVRELGFQSLSCPCDDIPGWPNTELPTPRSPINNQSHLGRICDRVTESHQNIPAKSPGLSHTLAVELAAYYNNKQKEAKTEEMRS